MKKVSVVLFFILANTIALISPAFSEENIVNTEIISVQNSIDINFTPAYIYQTIDTENIDIFSQTFKINTISSSELDISINYLESNLNLIETKESQLFKEITVINIKREGNDTLIDTDFDLKILSDKTYFFILELNLYNTVENTTGLRNLTRIRIPCIFTINKDPSTKNPKPDLSLKPDKKIYFNSNNILLNSQILNQSEKVIEFGGEVIAIDSGNTILFTQSIPSNLNTVFKPSEIKEEKIILNSLPKKGVLPYFGKLDIFLRGTVNSERHIETNKITIWIIPYELIFLSVSTIALITFLWIYFRRKVLMKKSLLKNIDTTPLKVN